MKPIHRVLVVAGLLGLTVGCDQATKRLAHATLQRTSHSFLFDVFRLTYAENKGAFLSLGGSLPDGARFWVLTVMVGVLLLGILAYALFARGLDGVQTAGYALIGGGGASNWVDRAMRDGSVIDFMNMGIGPLRTGVFNVADLAIVAGIAVLLVGGWRKERRQALKSAPPVA